MSFRKFIGLSKRNGAEDALLKTVFISLISSILVLSIFYLMQLRFIEKVVAQYGLFIFLAILSYALLLSSIQQVRSYRTFPCMSGMMVGMTIGMLAGFLPGFYVGATNGMFWGSLFGIVLGIGLGTWYGNCCGIMGILEGMMAGFMGGLMGAMTAIMMLNDHIRAAAVVIFVISAAIIVGLNFMLYGETRELERKNLRGTLFTIICSCVLTAITIIIIVWGPRSPLFQ